MNTAQLNQDNEIDARKARAEDQAHGAYQRAVNRGWTQEEAVVAWNECFETWMQD